MTGAGNISRVSFRPYCLPLRQVWRSAQGDIEQRRGWLIQIQTDDGQLGLGDCAPLPIAGTESWRQAQSRLGAMVVRLEGREADSAFAGLDGLMEDGRSHPALRCGLEMALIDLLARRENIPAARWLNPAAADFVTVNQNGGSLQRMLTDISPVSGVLKLKVGLATVAEELEQLSELARRYPAVRFRLDANQAWRLAEAEQFIAGCQDLPVECIEEPLQKTGAAPDLNALAVLQRRAAFSLALDESLRALDWSSLLQAQAVRRVVLKPLREGGIARVRTMATQAQAAGMEYVLTTTLDSAVGVWACVHLAAALDGYFADVEHQAVHGLATSSWLARDLVSAPELVPAPIMGPVAERIYLPARPGFGIDLDQIKID